MPGWRIQGRDTLRNLLEEVAHDENVALSSIDLATGQTGIKDGFFSRAFRLNTVRDSSFDPIAGLIAEADPLQLSCWRKVGNLAKPSLHHGKEARLSLRGERCWLDNRGGRRRLTGCFGNQRSRIGAGSDEDGRCSEHG